MSNLHDPYEKEGEERKMKKNQIFGWTIVALGTIHTLFLALTKRNPMWGLLIIFIGLVMTSWVEKGDKEKPIIKHELFDITNDKSIPIEDAKEDKH